MKCPDCGDTGLIVRDTYTGYCWCIAGQLRQVGDQPPRYDLTPED